MGHHDWEVQVTKRQHVPTTTAIMTAASTVSAATTNATLLLLIQFLLIPLVL